MNHFIRIKLLILLFLLCGIYTAGAQGVDNHWHFGNGHHIYFNTTPPTYINNSNIVTWESSAYISDEQGSLLFYTIGCRIWDRNGNQMPNATGLKGNGSNLGLTQGSGHASVQIVPHPINPDQYYVFSASSSEEGLDTVYYHIVDMSLNGGLGDVVSKNIVLLDAGPNGLRESVTATYGACGSYWFIVMRSEQYNTALYAYKIDASGISATPVISTPPTAMSGFYGLMEGVLIAESGSAAFRPTNLGVMRMQFDRATGQFSNYEIIPNTIGCRYLELSASEQFLYTTSSYGPVSQYNLQLYPNLAAISASGVVLNLNPTTSEQHTRMKRGPDHKIYIHHFGASPFNSYITRIENPDLQGLACNFNLFFMTIPSMQSFVGLGAKTLSRTAFQDTVVLSDTVYMPCTGSSTATLQAAHPDIVLYQWYDGSTANQHTVTQEGLYWVRGYSSNCKLYVDSFRVLATPPPPDLGRDTVLCTGSTLTLNAYHPYYEQYTWSNGSTGSSLTVNTPGKYYVTAQSGPCLFSDTIIITGFNPELYIQQEDTTICAGSPILLQVVTNINNTIHWTTGQKGPSITIDQAGNYKAYSESICGLQADSVTIDAINCDCKPIVPNAFTPNGDGRNDVFMPVFNPDCDALYYELKIYNRYGQLVYMTNRKGTGWDGTWNYNRPADAGVYFYTISLTNRYGDTDKRLLKGDIVLVR